MVLVQLADLHIGADWVRTDPLETLSATVDAGRRQFGIEPVEDEPLHYATELGPVRLIVLDTTIPGKDAGRLDAESLSWLERELAACPRESTLLAMHHPPLLTGSPAWDRIALIEASRAGLADTLERHSQVRQILGAHLQRPLLTQFSGRPLGQTTSYFQTVTL